MKESDLAPAPYVAAWKIHRRWQILGVVLLIGFVPFADFVAERFPSPLLSFALFFGWAFLLLANSLQRQGFRCPRCGKRFFFNPPHDSLIARHCRHCGLPKWAVRSEP